MIDFIFYHGTSKREWQNMQAVGRFSVRRDNSRWLAASGVYLFCNNPLLAFRFAAERTRQLRALNRIFQPDVAEDEGVVLQVRLRTVDERQVLNLTTPEGMQALFLAHDDLSELMERNLPELVHGLATATTDSYRVYYADAIVKALGPLAPPFDDLRCNPEVFIAQFLHELGLTSPSDLAALSKQIHEEQTGRGKSSFNFDCAAITRLAYRQGYAVVFAAIQEGQPLNYLFHEHSPEWSRTLGFRGIRLRDHLEVCVIDPALFEWPPVESPVKEEAFNVQFWQETTKFRDQKLFEE